MNTIIYYITIREAGCNERRQLPPNLPPNSPRVRLIELGGNIGGNLGGNLGGNNKDATYRTAHATVDNNNSTELDSV